MENNLLKNFSNNKPLIILDLANNHNGSLEHGIQIINEIKSTPGINDFSVAIKLQYRSLPEFIHTDFQSRRDLKYVDRFLSTMLSWAELLELRKHIADSGFLAACTPFDEVSVNKIIEHDYDILKIASASFTDWSLLESVSKWVGPIIASTGGVKKEEIDRVVTFFSNRNKSFALMHCVAAYPTANSDLLLNRIFALKERYAEIPIGYSTHEDPNNASAGPLALAAGAVILERHVGSLSDGTTLNKYSSDTMQLKNWLDSLKDAMQMLGPSEIWNHVNEAEQQSISSLRRYAYLREDLVVGSKIEYKDIYFAIPGTLGQLQANSIGKYDDIRIKMDLAKDSPLLLEAITYTSKKEVLLGISKKALELCRVAGVTLPRNSILEISHHQGLENFKDIGCCMITVVNREYCKKLIILLPGQSHPPMFHKKKDETFFLLHGNLRLGLNKEYSEMSVGETVAITPGVIHEFSSTSGAILEEVSSTHLGNDSFYLDESIQNNPSRKTFVRYWM
jgi:N-acetylneuraminate synthase